MLFKSALITQASGSIGGMTASHNSGGQYFRARTIPTDPNTPSQAAVRAIMSSLVSRWLSLLTGGQRNAWNQYALNVSLQNPLGDPIFVSGQNMFIRTNVVALQNGLPLIADGPTIYNTGAFSPVTFTVAALLDNHTVTYTDTDPWNNEDDSALILQVSRPQNGTVNFFKGPWRLAGRVLGDLALPPPSPLVFQGPFSLAAGQRVWMRVRVIRSDGRLSGPVIIGPSTVA